jgi:hypothetical protein
MWNRLAAWLGRRANPLRIARQRGADAFAAAFRSTQFTILSLPEAFRAGIPTSVSQEEILAFIERAAKDLAERDSFDPFFYEAPGTGRVLPLFMDMKSAETFSLSYVSELRRILPFHTLATTGDALADGLASYDVVVINARSKDELLLSGPEIRAIVAKVA